MIFTYKEDDLKDIIIDMVYDEIHNRLNLSFSTDNIEVTMKERLEGSYKMLDFKITNWCNFKFKNHDGLRVVFAIRLGEDIQHESILAIKNSISNQIKDLMLESLLKQRGKKNDNK